VTSTLAPRWPIAVAAAAVVAAGATFWITLDAEFLAYPGWLAVQKADFILGPVLTGLYWLHRRPQSRFGWVLIAFGFVGAVPFFFVPPLNAALFGRIGERAPDELQGRATSAAVQVTSLLGPVGPIAAGALIGVVGAKQTVIAYGCLLAALAVLATLSRALRGEPA
jgi:hypothetical protein